MLLSWKWVFILIMLWRNFRNTIAQKGCPLPEAIVPCRCLVRGEEYQIWCTHSDLPTVLDGIKTVAKYITNPIDELILENNILPSLPGRTFFPLKVLRLMLRYNGLERVSSDWLAGLQSTLLEIFIVEPQLRSLPDDSLAKLNALQAVTIQTNQLKRLPLFSGLPKLRYLQIESESLAELSPENFKDNPRLEKLHVTSSPQLTKLEANLLHDLPSLVLVNISYCGIQWMHPRAISRLPLLKELCLVGNKITNAGMVSRGSRELPQLEVIRLDHNHIDKLGEATFVDLPVLKKIYLSNNRITELHHGAFHRVPSLKSLDLNKNMLRRVHPESFLQQSGSGLEELSLLENSISHVAELRSLLDALPRLVFLDMSYNNLEMIPYGALRGHPTLEYLNLDYNKLHLIDREAFMAMPALRELRLKNNSLSNALEPPLWNLPALKGLDLSGNLFKTLEPNFLANLPLLRRIDLSNNKLTAIDPTLFLPTHSLEHINISHNNLNAIHPTTFRHLVNLYELDVSYNRLLRFVPGLQKGIEYLHLHHNKIIDIPLLPSSDLDLPSLRMLDLSSNRIEKIPKDSFATLPRLRRLYLGKNLLQVLEENHFTGLNKLENLDLQDNRVVQIHPKSFKEMAELKEIHLNNNQLDILVTDIFKSTPALKRLDLSRNQLAEILPGTLDKNIDIQIIDASHNVLVQVPSAFNSLKKLRTLDLSNNRIKNIDSKILNSLTSLREIKLTNNYVQEINQGDFNNLQHLRLIHLDNNEVQFIEQNAVRALPSLKLIKLNRNKIMEIPSLAFNNLPSLQVVELQENELLNIAPNSFNLVPHLLMLNLSHNQLPDFEKAGLQSLVSLEMLDVSNNRISRMTSPALEKMEWLVELRIDNNDICGVQGFTFGGMPRLRVLSLKNNKMMSFPEHAVQRLRSNIAVLDIDGNPLVCACNMLWLQIWLQESAQTGPHCIDGTLLRDIPLSRQDCLKEEKNIEIVAPGCEAASLIAPGVYKTSQVFSQWLNLKSFNNITKEVGNKNHLAPSPEESDYFYDEYVDYPYNESIVDSNDFPDGKQTNKGVVEAVTVEIPLSTKSPHFIPGDTPTIYAAIKNKTAKPGIPAKVSNSPSSSGFTFFGVPLSNLSLNQLLGGGIGRMETTVPSRNIVAERKTAIVNNPANAGRINMGNMPPNLPFKMQPPPYIGNKQLPSLPEIHTGFVPILPGEGGFKPIPNPNLQLRIPPNNINANSVQIESPRDIINVSPTSLINIVNPATEVGSIDNQSFTTASSATNLIHKNQSIDSSKLQPLVNSTRVPPYSINKVENTSQPLLPKPVNITTKTIGVDKNKNFKKKIQIESETTSKNSTLVETISVIVQEITTDEIEQTTLIPEIEVSTSIKKIDGVLIEPSDNIQSVPVVTTEVPRTDTSLIPKSIMGTAEAVPANTTSNILEIAHVGEKIEEPIVEKAEEVPLSASSMPKDQRPQFKAGGRSTVTKVSSPHAASNTPLKSNYESSRLSGSLSHREGKTSHSYPFYSTTPQTNDDVDWYFANYNKTNLEPYVAKITSTSDGAWKHGGRQCMQLFLIIYCIKAVLIPI